MPVTLVGTEWVDGNLVFKDKDNNVIATWDGTNRKFAIPSGAVLENAGNKLPATFLVTARLDGAAAATAANYGPFFIAPFACEVVSVRESHTVAGNDAGAVTLDIEKLTGTQAPDAGAPVLGATKINLKGTANTVVSPALTGTAADKQLAAGDRLCLKDAGTPTAVAGVAVTIELKAI